MPTIEGKTLMDIAVEFGDTWHQIIRELSHLQTFDPSVVQKILLGEDRKLYVGLLLVGVSLVYLFVFMTE